MLTKDQRDRLNMLRSLGGEEEISKSEALDALESNFWDTAMAFEWIKRKRKNPDISQEAFHAEYNEARQKAASVLPSDRYDLTPTKKEEVVSNRASRRASKKNKNKKK